MKKEESQKFFENWLRAYCDHLHLIRQGSTSDLVRADVSKPPTSEKAGGATIAPARKSTNA